MKYLFIPAFACLPLLPLACTTSDSESSDAGSGGSTSSGGSSSGGSGGSGGTGGSSGSGTGGSGGNPSAAGAAGEGGAGEAGAAGADASGGSATSGSGGSGGSGGSMSSGGSGGSSSGGSGGSGGGCGTPMETPMTCTSFQSGALWRAATERVEIPLSNFPTAFVSASYVLSYSEPKEASIEGSLLIIPAPVSQVGIQFALLSLELTDECGNTWLYDNTNDYVMVFVTDGGGDGDAICG